MAQIYIGTSGFSQQQFYPDKLPGSQKLKFYTEVFNSVEINSTFYHMPRVTTLENWRSNTPEDFVFTFKVNQAITHANKANPEVLKNWFDRFEIFASPKPRHLMLFQYAASYKFNLVEFKKLLKLLPPTFLYAFEFRHQDWFTNELFEILTRAKMVLVLSDSPLKNGEYLWPKIDLPDNPFLYIRFHGSPQLYRSSYTSQQLQEYSELIIKNLAAGKNVYCYFNNDAQGYATKNAQSLQKLLL